MSENLRDKIAEALLAEGAAPGSSLHSWRCEYPDRYGPCDCVQETADVVLAVVGPELDRLRAEVERLSSGRVSNAEKERDDALALIERMSSLDGAADDAGPANAWPANPGEFAARWNALDDGARARWLGEAVEAMSSIDAMTWRAEAAEAEVAQLRAALVKVRVAVELVVQDVRAQRGDHIAGLVEDSFAAHMALASVPAVDAGEVAGPCRSGCGPGYRYGDEGCRHTPAAVDAGDREPASEGGA